jgi:hypothetical protein
MDQLVDYATVTVVLNEEVTSETIGPDGKPLGERAGNAFSMTIHSLSVFLGNLLVFLVGASPILVPLIIIGLIILFIIKPPKRLRKKTKTETRKPAEESEKEDNAG